MGLNGRFDLAFAGSHKEGDRGFFIEMSVVVLHSRQVSKMKRFLRKTSNFSLRRAVIPTPQNEETMLLRQRSSNSHGGSCNGHGSSSAGSSGSAQRASGVTSISGLIDLINSLSANATSLNAVLYSGSFNGPTSTFCRWHA
jgi:hypothetical protein